MKRVLSRPNWNITSATAEDLDVSGRLPIRERPKIGKLLSLVFLDEWDVLIVYKFDPGFRNRLDFVTFRLLQHAHDQAILAGFIPLQLQPVHHIGNRTT